MPLTTFRAQALALTEIEGSVPGVLGTWVYIGLGSGYLKAVWPDFLWVHLLTRDPDPGTPGPRLARVPGMPGHRAYSGSGHSWVCSGPAPVGDTAVAAVGLCPYLASFGKSWPSEALHCQTGTP